MLASSSSNQAIGGGIAIGCKVGDNMVIEPDRRHGAILEMGGVASRIVGVKKGLKDQRIGCLAGQLQQPEGLRVVAVRRGNAIAVHDALPLALLVVVYVRDERVSRGTLLDPNLLQQVGRIVCRQVDTAVGGGALGDAIEGGIDC